MIRRLLPFSLLLFALFAKAQEVGVISPVVSFDYGSPLFINRAAGVFNQSASVESGTSSAFSYGLGLQGAIGLSGPIGLLGRVSGVYSTGKFNSSLVGGDTISGYEWKLLAEALLDWQPSAISLRAGPWLSARMSGAVNSNSSGVSTSSTLSNAVHYGLAAGLAWKIKNFPVEPELNTHLDLTELPQAGANAWSIGILLTYHFGKTTSSEAPAFQAAPPSSPVPQPLSVPMSIHFLVNGSLSNGNPPLERVETHIKDYAMVDSPNASPKVTQWIEESYHLPRLALSCEFPRSNGADLILFKDNLPLLEKIFSGSPKPEGNFDTVLDLDRDSAWQNVLAHLNTEENNRLIAELRSNSETARDTLVLPPVDTSRVAETIVKEEFRFELLDNYSRYKGGEQSLDLLLDRMKEILDSTNTIRIREGVDEQNLPGNAALEKKLARVLGNREIERTTSADIHEGLVVVMER